MIDNSEIFEEFYKIAAEKGLVKRAQEKDSKQLKDYKNDVYPRVGSDSIDKIEALYGVKPDKAKSMEYEYNIVEDAHPNQVVLAPSYDKLNGLVENINERNQILINISRKPSTGLIVHKKYAESELAYALVQVANDMDNRDNEQLRVLADTCIAQLKKKAFNWGGAATGIAGALLPSGPIGWIALGAAVLGAVYLYNHINDPDRGLVANVNNAIQQIDDLIGEDWFHQTFYATLKPDFIANLKKLRSDLQSLKSEADRFNTIEDQVHSLKTVDELKQTTQDSGATIVQKANEFKAFLQNIEPEIKQAIDLFSNANVRDLAIKDESWFSGLVSKIEPIFHGNWGLFSDRFDDIKQALIPLKDSIDATFAQINHIDASKGQRQAAIGQSVGAQKHIEAPELGGSAPTQAKTPQTMSDYEAALKELSGE